MPPRLARLPPARHRPPSARVLAAGPAHAPRHRAAPPRVSGWRSGALTAKLGLIDGGVELAQRRHEAADMAGALGEGETKMSPGGAAVGIRVHVVGLPRRVRRQLEQRSSARLRRGASEKGSALIAAVPSPASRKGAGAAPPAFGGARHRGCRGHGCGRSTLPAASISSRVSGPLAARLAGLPPTLAPGAHAPEAPAGTGVTTLRAAITARSAERSPSISRWPQ